MKADEMLKEVADYEKDRSVHVKNSPYYPSYHLAPPVGWLNDPNGLSQIGEKYHFYFQYSPFDPQGGQKFWGHFESKNLINWKYTGAVLAPDCIYDKDGVYSGSALAEDGRLFLYYTGNVKEEGQHDYVLSGRGANTILVETSDGCKMGEKKLLMTNWDYPSDLTCHVRDPKVFKENGIYYMVQGARTKEDKGVVLVFESSDRENWQYKNRLQTGDHFGYMWECPDLFLLEGRRFLSVSPQGLPAEKYRFQNTHQSGYFTLEGDFTSEGQYLLHSFREWDMGFDFYAPQTFCAKLPDGTERRILTGWSGMIDCDYDNQPATEEGWQHMLTLPRELTIRDHVIYQMPVREIKALRKQETAVETDQFMTAAASELLIEKEGGEDIEVQIGSGLLLSYHSLQQEFSMEFTDASGRGRTVRRAALDNLTSLDIFLDHSVIEVYLNDGLYVFTSHFYPAFSYESRTEKEGNVGIKIKGKRKSVTKWNMKGG